MQPGQPGVVPCFSMSSRFTYKFRRANGLGTTGGGSSAGSAKGSSAMKIGCAWPAAATSPAPSAPGTGCQGSPFKFFMRSGSRRCTPSSLLKVRALNTPSAVPTRTSSLRSWTPRKMPSCQRSWSWLRNLPASRYMTFSPNGGKRRA